MAKTSKANNTDQPENFEAASSELEKIVAAMETGQMSLEASLEAYKRGVELLRYCQNQLQDAQQQVRILDGDLLKDYTVPETHDR